MSYAVVVSDDGAVDIVVSDMCRAYLHAPAKRVIFRDLSAEDQEKKNNEVGRLHICLCRMRDAANGWQQASSEHLVQIVIMRGLGHPAVVHHQGRGNKTFAHGGDYISAGAVSKFKWTARELKTKHNITQHIFNKERETDTSWKPMP